ncbi:MAG: hypothetical protein J6K53_13510 [Roseburia sp.]|nr:hypothetical protein [Roseburia sp.]
MHEDNEESFYLQDNLGSPTELVDLNGLYPVAGVTAEVGEDLNGQTHPGGPTAGVTSAIGDALSGRNEYTGNTSCDNEGTDISDFLEVIGNRVSLNSTANDAAEAVFDVAICPKQYTLSTLWKQIKNAEQYKVISQSLGNFRRATRAKIKVVDEELEKLGKSIGDIGKVSGALDVVGVGIDVTMGVTENVENDAPASRMASDVLVDVGVSGLEIGVTTGTSTVVSTVVTGFVAGTSIPGIGNLAGQ